jgi:hypothetical protein
VTVPRGGGVYIMTKGAEGGGASRTNGGGDTESISSHRTTQDPGELRSGLYSGAGKVTEGGAEAASLQVSTKVRWLVAVAGRGGAGGQQRLAGVLQALPACFLANELAGLAEGLSGGADAVAEGA